MTQDLTFALQFSFPGGMQAVLDALQSVLPGAERAHGALRYRDNVLKLERSPLCGEIGEFELQVSVFPLSDLDLDHQRLVLQEVRAALVGLAGEVGVLAEDYLL